MTYMCDSEHIPGLLTFDTELQLIDGIWVNMLILSLIPVYGVFKAIWVSTLSDRATPYSECFSYIQGGIFRTILLVDLGKCGITLKWLDLPSAHAEGNIGASGLERCGNNVCFLSAMLQSPLHLYLSLEKQATGCTIPSSLESQWQEIP